MTIAAGWLDTRAVTNLELKAKSDEVVLILLLNKATDSAGTLAEVCVLKIDSWDSGGGLKPQWLLETAKARGLSLANVKEIRLMSQRNLTPSFVSQLVGDTVPLGKAILVLNANEPVFLLPREGRLRKLKAPPTTKKLRVLVVDDSETIRSLLSKVIGEDPDLECVGTVAMPSLVEAAIEKYRPDVLTLDIHMPEMNGVELLRKLMPKYGLPSLMISSLSIEDGTLVLDALEAGAIDYIQKPSFADLKNVAPIICEKLKSAASANVKARVLHKVSRVGRKMDTERLILIGSSTGGTEALKQVLTSLPNVIPPIVIVQHIPAVFSKAFADRLNLSCEFEVKEAEDGDVVLPNRVLIAPGGLQMSLRERGDKIFVHIEDSAPVNRHKPSVDFLFDSALKVKSRKMVAGILTGMGADGARGLLALRSMGARTFAQNEASCVVYGMPKEAVKLNAAEKIVALDDVAAQLVTFCQNPHS